MKVKKRKLNNGKRNKQPRKVSKETVNIETLSIEIEKKFRQKSKSGIRARLDEIELAHLFFKLKEETGHGNFLKTVEYRFPYMGIRYIQEMMLLLHSFDFDLFTCLCGPPKYQLKLIIKLAKKQNIRVMTFLEKSEIDLDVDPNNHEHYLEFLIEFKRLALQEQKTEKQKTSVMDAEKSKSEKKGDGKKKSMPLQFRDWLVDFTEKRREKGENLSGTQVNKLKFLIKQLKKVVDEFSE